jgi:hypothetical protein
MQFSAQFFLMSIYKEIMLQFGTNHFFKYISTWSAKLASLQLDHYIHEIFKKPGNVAKGSMFS